MAERLELINGRVYEIMPGPSPLHQELVGNIYNPIKNHLNGKGSELFCGNKSPFYSCRSFGQLKYKIPLQKFKR